MYACAVAKYEVQAGGKSVGHAYVNPDPESKGGSVIEDLYVDPAHRRQGLGRQLLGQVKQNHKGPLRIRPRPHRDMAVGIEDLKNFYAGEGFKHTGDKRDNMVLDKLAFSLCIDEIAKLAALDPDEEKLFREIFHKQREYDRLSSSGNMSEAEGAVHRANTERLKHFLEKKRGTAKSIPDWAKNLNEELPESYLKPPPTPFMGYVRQHPYLAAAGLGAMYGGSLGGLVQATRSKEDKEEAVQRAEKKGPVSTFAARHPALATAAYTGASLPATLYGAQKAGLPGALAGTLAPRVAWIAADKGLSELSKRRRREEFSAGEKTPKVPKPKAA